MSRPRSAHYRVGGGALRGRLLWGYAMSRTSLDDRVWVSVHSLAREVHLAPAKLKRWIFAGELPAVNLASRTDGLRSRLYVHRDEWARFLDARRAVPAPPAARRRRRTNRTEVVEFYK